jgi:hypothetical protein
VGTRTDGHLSSHLPSSSARISNQSELEGPIVEFELRVSCVYNSQKMPRLMLSRLAIQRSYLPSTRAIPKLSHLRSTAMSSLASSGSVDLTESPHPPLPPFSKETALQKVKAAQDAWNTTDPATVSLAYTADSIWRNRDTFLKGMFVRSFSFLSLPSTPLPLPSMLPVSILRPLVTTTLVHILTPFPLPYMQAEKKSSPS